jgi:hypothetical protein
LTHSSVAVQTVPGLDDEAAVQAVPEVTGKNAQALYYRESIKVEVDMIGSTPSQTLLLQIPEASRPTDGMGRKPESSKPMTCDQTGLLTPQASPTTVSQSSTSRHAVPDQAMQANGQVTEPIHSLRTASSSRKSTAPMLRDVFISSGVLTDFTGVKAIKTEPADLLGVKVRLYTFHCFR